MIDTIINSFDVWTDAQGIKSKGRVKSIENISLEGINALRDIVLDLAFSGRLIPQNNNDKTSDSLFETILKEKERLIETGEIRKQKKLKPIHQEEIVQQIPKSWKWTRLIDVFDVRDGTHDSPKSQITGYPLVTSKNLSSGKLNITNVKYISESDYLKIIERSKVDKGDILFAMIGSIGNPVIVDQEIEIAIKNVALFKYYDKKYSNPEFLKYFLIYATSKFKAQAKGAVQSFVSLGKLRSFLFPLAPLEEQERIVTKVDELMALCDKLENERETNLKTHQLLVKTILASLTQAKDADEFQVAWERMSTHFDSLFCTEDSIEQLKETILSLAIQGKLVNHINNELVLKELGKEIIKQKSNILKISSNKKTLQGIKANELVFNFPENWKLERLGSIAIVERGGSPRPIKSYITDDPDGLNWIKIGDTDKGGKYITSTNEKITKEGLHKTRQVYPGDFLLTNSMSYGRPYITKIEGCIHDGWLRISPPQVLNPDYLYHLLSSNYVKLFFDREASGAVVQNLNADKVHKLPIPIPPPEEQLLIV